MGFKEYCKNNQSENVNTKNFTEKETKRVEELYDEYKDKNEDELLSELFKNVNKQKKDGTFNYNSLKSTIDRMSPFLTKEQNLKIKELLEKIK